MCGSTGAQTEIQQEQLDAYQQAQDMTKAQYAKQSEIYAPMAAKFGSIFDMGASQKGFSDAEDTNLKAQAVEGTAENYAAAAKATGEQIAARGGVAGMPSGAADSLRAKTAVSAAQEESREESQITSANYAQGYQEWKDAGAGLETIASGENPLGYEGAATSSGTAVADTANQIATEQNSWINAAAGIGGALISENPHNVFG